MAITPSTTEEKLKQNLLDGFLSDLSREAIRSVRSEFLRELLFAYKPGSQSYAITGAIITGALDLEDQTINCGLSFKDCIFDTRIILTNSKLHAIEMHDCQLQGISGRNLKITGDLRLINCDSTGGIHLPIARISGSIICSGLSITIVKDDDHDAMRCDGLSVSGDAFFDYDEESGRRFTATGPIRLLGAQIGGDLDFTYAQIKTGIIGKYDVQADMAAVYIDRAIIKGTLSLRGSDIIGVNAVSAANANIDADLDARGATLRTNEEINLQSYWRDWPKSLSAPHLHVCGDVLLHGASEANDRDFNAVSAIDLRNARIDGDLILRSKSQRTEIKALTMLGAKITGALNAYENLSIDYLDLRNAKVGSLIDSPDAWPSTKGNLLLNNFEFDSFGGNAPVDYENRITWLSLQYKKSPKDIESFWPQPYEQTAKALRNAGHGSEAKDILIAKQWHALYADRVGRDVWRIGAQIWHFLLGVTVGFGYRPFLAMAYAGGFILIGACAFDRAHSEGYLFLSTKAKIDLPQDRPLEFNNFVYSVESFVPIINLRHREHWILTTAHPIKGENHFYQYYAWIHMGLGWFFTTLAVAGFTGLIKRD